LALAMQGRYNSFEKSLISGGLTEEETLVLLERNCRFCKNYFELISFDSSTICSPCVGCSGC